MDSASIARFIKLFLPEGEINRRDKNELRIITAILKSLLMPLGKKISTDALLKGFSEMSYRIAVEEPIKDGEESIAYIATNSHSIYIGVDTGCLQQLSIFSKGNGKGQCNKSEDFENFHRKLKDFFV